MFSSLCRQLSSACAVHSKSLSHHHHHNAISALSTVASGQRCCLSSMASSSTKTSGQQHEEFVSVLKLNMLQDNPGAVKTKRRIGRGIGSSKGKTSGRGHNGQKSRAGGSISLGFEGGQTKFYKLLPKRGFTNNRHKTDMLAINLGTIQDYIDMGRIAKVMPSDAEQSTATPTTLTMKDLLDAGLCTASSVKYGIKLLAKGKERLRTPIHLEISRASEEAIEAVEAIGGEVTTVHYNRLALRALLKPQKFVNEEDGTGRLPKFARPPPKWQPYYTNWERNRGYLSVQAQMRKLLKDRPELEPSFAKALEDQRNTA